MDHPASLMLALALCAAAPVFAADDATAAAPDAAPPVVLDSDAITAPEAPEAPALLSIDSFLAADAPFMAAGKSVIDDGLAIEEYAHGMLALKWHIDVYLPGDAKPPRKLFGNRNAAYDIHDDGLLVVAVPTPALADQSRDMATSQGFTPRRSHIGPLELMVLGNNPEIEGRIEAVLRSVVAHASATAPAHAP